MAYQHVTVERAANVATLTLNRPDAYNALNLPLGRELFTAAIELDAVDAANRLRRHQRALPGCAVECVEVPARRRSAPAAATRRSRHRRRPDGAEDEPRAVHQPGDHLAEREELVGRPAGLVEGSVVVVRRHVRLVRALVVGAVREAEVRAAVEHVDVDRRTRRQQRVQLACRLLDRGRVVVLAPVVEPAVPELGAHQGPRRLVPAQGGEEAALQQQRGDRRPAPTAPMGPRSDAAPKGRVIEVAPKRAAVRGAERGLERGLERGRANARSERVPAGTPFMAPPSKVKPSILSTIKAKPRAGRK